MVKNVTEMSCVFLLQFLWLNQVYSHPVPHEEDNYHNGARKSCPRFGNFYGLSSSDQGCCIAGTSECAVQVKDDKVIEQQVKSLGTVKRKKRNRRRRGK